MSGIKAETFYKWCGYKDYCILDGLVNKSWIILNPATDMAHLHPMVAALMEEELAKDASCCDTLIEAVIEERNHLLGTTYAHKQMHRELLASIARKLPADHPRLFDLEWARIYTLFDLSDAGIAEMEKLLPHTHDLDLQLELHHRIAHALCLSGNNLRAIEAAQRGLAVAEAIPRESLSHQQGRFQYALYSRMAEALRNLGRYDESAEYARKNLAGCATYYGASPQDSVAWGSYHLARTLYMRNQPGDLEESERIFLDSIALLEQVKDKWSPCLFREFLAQIHMRRGEYDQALDISQTIANTLIHQIGEIHQDIAINLQLRGNIYRSAGEEEKAMGCYRQALHILEELNHTRSKERLMEIMESGEIGYLS